MQGKKAAGRGRGRVKALRGGRGRAQALRYGNEKAAAQRDRSAKPVAQRFSPALSSCPADPLILFRKWLRAAERAGEPIAEAVALATSTRDGRPSVRMVLHRGLSRGGFVFYTNYTSRKAADLVENPRAALVFHWPRLERQVRVEGRVVRLTRAESDRYFQARPRESRLSAWASPQSAKISGRSFLEAEFARVHAQFRDRRIPCPPFWGGFRIVANCIEFWQEQPHRLHDRVVYRKKRNGWTNFRLGP
ncbi:MAG: pyridoxamine 5'-phosphate oxidase [Acidobacteria bacterium]|nr:MAG: pyridoxamine 5'-phosphate oxidase [Acidobacteriota bacterium]